MPKKIEPKIKERCVQQMLEHVAEYPNPTSAAQVVARRNGVGAESVRRWYLQEQIDSDDRRVYRRMPPREVMRSSRSAGS